MHLPIRYYGYAFCRFLPSVTTLVQVTPGLPPILVGLPFWFAVISPAYSLHCLLTTALPLPFLLHTFVHAYLCLSHATTAPSLPHTCARAHGSHLPPLHLHLMRAGLSFLPHTHTTASFPIPACSYTPRFWIPLRLHGWVTAPRLAFLLHTRALTRLLPLRSRAHLFSRFCHGSCRTPPAPAVTHHLDFRTPHRTLHLTHARHLPARCCLDSLPVPSLRWITAHAHYDLPHRYPGCRYALPVTARSCGSWSTPSRYVRLVHTIHWVLVPRLRGYGSHFSCLGSFTLGSFVTLYRPTFAVWVLLSSHAAPRGFYRALRARASHLLPRFARRSLHSHLRDVTPAHTSYCVHATCTHTPRTLFCAPLRSFTCIYTYGWLPATRYIRSGRIPGAGYILHHILRRYGRYRTFTTLIYGHTVYRMPRCYTTLPRSPSLIYDSDSLPLSPLPTHRPAPPTTLPPHTLCVTGRSPFFPPASPLVPPTSRCCSFLPSPPSCLPLFSTPFTYHIYTIYVTFGFYHTYVYVTFTT